MQGDHEILFEQKIKCLMLLLLIVCIITYCMTLSTNQFLFYCIFVHILKSRHIVYFYLN